MTLKIGERPPVISKILYTDLLKFLGFRHVVRHAYGFDLNENKLQELANIFESVSENFLNEIKEFCQFLKDQVN